jgi:hypothetical protein
MLGGTKSLIVFWKIDYLFSKFKFWKDNELIE